jgi:hypothetical protein
MNWKGFGRSGRGLILRYYPRIQDPGSSVSMVSGYGLDDRAIEVRSLAEAKGFFL